MSAFLIVRLGSLGDVVHAIPVAAALRAALPDARIDWATDPRYVPLLDLVRVLDGRIPLDPRDAWRPARQSGFLRTMRELRGVKYDWVLDLQGLLKSAAIARAARGRRVVGFPRSHLREPLASVFYSETPDPRDAAHVIQQNLALLAPIGVLEPRVEFPLVVPRTPTAESVVRRFAPSGFVLINPGAAWPNKRWPPACFGAVAAALRATYGFRSLVLWGPGERMLAHAVADASAGAAEVSPPTSIPELAGIARMARLMITGDTGPMHLAAAVGTPIVGLFGPTRPERNGPWAADDVVLSRVDGCSCVYERRCRRAAPCINEIGVEEVLDAVDRRLRVHG